MLLFLVLTLYLNNYPTRYIYCFNIVLSHILPKELKLQMMGFFNDFDCQYGSDAVSLIKQWANTSRKLADYRNKRNLLLWGRGEGVMRTISWTNVEDLWNWWSMTALELPIKFRIWDVCWNRKYFQLKLKSQLSIYIF